MYPFMASFNFISFGVFVVFSTIIGGLFYCIGRILAELFGRNSKYKILFLVVVNAFVCVLIGVLKSKRL